MTLNVTVCQKEKTKLHWVTLPNGKKVPIRSIEKNTKKDMFAKKLKNVDVILNPNGDHIQGIVETNVPNVLWNKKADMYGSTSKVKGYNGWKDKDGQKRDYSSSTRQNYEIQTNKSLKEEL